MIVNSSQIRMDASSGHKDVSKTTNGKTLSRNHSGRNDENFTLYLPDISHKSLRQDSTNLTGSQQANSCVRAGNSEEICSDTEHVISKVIDELTGTKTQVIDPQNDKQSTTEQESIVPFRPAMRRFYQIGGQEFRMSFTSHKVQTEYEFMNFKSSGEVVTADGRNIQFSLDISLQRTSVVHESILGKTAAGYFIDPLVMHFDSGLHALSEQSFLFDINSDGKKEAIPGLRRGSGFLALDIDGDGTIGSGNELFGPTSGSGFADLAIHDLDENLWIDENDPVFSKLQVWMNASSGQQQLLSLKEAGVGAISLTNSGTLFNLKSSSNKLLGQVASSGIFLTEEGKVKSLQDYNFALPTEDDEFAANGNDQGNNQLIASLRSIISTQQNQLEVLAQRQRIRSLKRQVPDNLSSKFWQWQDKNNFNHHS